MEKQNEENYKLLNFVTENCCHVLQDLLQHFYQQDHIFNFQNFLDKFKHELFHEWIPRKDCCDKYICNYKSQPRKNPVIQGHQWTKLYQKSGVMPRHNSIGDCPCMFKAIPRNETGKLDVSLLCLILRLIYPSSRPSSLTASSTGLSSLTSKLSPLQEDAVKHIQTERNNLAHADKKVTESFECRWNKLENCLKDLATNCLPLEYQEQMTKEAKELKNRDLTPKESFMLLHGLNQGLQDVKQGLEDMRNTQQAILDSIAQNPAANGHQRSASVPSKHNLPFEPDSGFLTQLNDIDRTHSLITRQQCSGDSPLPHEFTSEEDRQKMETFIKSFDDLRESFTECETTDDAEFCKEDYKGLCVQWSTDCLEKCWKQLAENCICRYEPEKYIVIDEEKFLELRKMNYSLEHLKIEDNRRMIEIEKKLIRGVIPEFMLEIPDCKDELRIVIVGKTGVGKSALGNLILGIENFFTESIQANSATATVKQGKRKFKVRWIKILDTPGLFDTKRTMDDVRMELAKCISIFNEGFHAMAVVMNGSNLKFTEEEENTVKEIKKFFGEKILGFCFLVITHMDGLGENLVATKFLKEIEPGRFKDLVYKDFGKRVMFVENSAKSKYEQDGFTEKFIGYVDFVRQQQKGEVYNHQLFEDARKICEQLKQEEVDRLKQQKAAETGRLVDIAIFIRDEAERAMVRMISDKTLKDLELENNDVILAVKKDVVSHVTGSLTKDQMEYLDKLPDNNLKETICLKGIQKVRNIMVNIVNHAKDKQIVQQYLRDKIRDAKLKNKKIDLTGDQLLQEVRKEIPGSLSDDITLYDITIDFDCSDDPAVAEQIKTIERLTTELHEKIVEIAEKYFQKISNADLEKVQNDNYNAAVKHIRKKLNEKISSEAKAYFTMKTIEDEVRDKLQREKERLIKMRETTEKLPAEVTCFPGDATVLCNRGDISMSEIKIGDKVLTFDFSKMSAKFEDVILLSHADSEAISEMIQITTPSKTLILSTGHLLYINDSRNPVPAQQVKMGDNILVNINNSFVWVSVCDVTMVTKKGLYCPHTTGGSIFVNDVLVSCGTDQVSSAVTNAAMFMVNILYSYLPLAIFHKLYGQNRSQDVPYLLTKLRPWYFKLKTICP